MMFEYEVDKDGSNMGSFWAWHDPTHGWHWVHVRSLPVSKTSDKCFFGVPNPTVTK